MAQTLSTSGIVNGQDVQAWHVTQSIDAFTGVSDFDISVSGSFTLTGSLKVSGSISGQTSESSSIAITSSFSQIVDIASSSSFAEYNSGDLLTLQLYAPQTASLATSTGYYFAVGTNLMLANRTGLVVPIDATIVKATIVSSVGGATGDMQSQVYLYKNGSSVVTFENLRYINTHNYTLKSNINQQIAAGDFLSIRILTNGGGSPTLVTHKVTLTLKPN